MKTDWTHKAFAIGFVAGLLYLAGKGLGIW